MACKYGAPPGKSEGMFVQCSLAECAKWRFLPQFEDPALVSKDIRSASHVKLPQVPEDWQCSMNEDPRGNTCAKGRSEEWVEGSAEMVSSPSLPSHPGAQVDTAYAAGSMVWAKVPGFPWWPGMVRAGLGELGSGVQVDFCPDTEEFYWLDAWDDPAGEAAETGELTHYHVMLFGVPSVTRCHHMPNMLRNMPTTLNQGGGENGKSK